MGICQLELLSVSSETWDFSNITCFTKILNLKSFSKLWGNSRSSHPEEFCKKGALRNFAKFTGKHLGQSLWYKCFPVNFAKFLRTLFLTEHLRWLLFQLFYHVCYTKSQVSFYLWQIELVLKRSKLQNIMTRIVEGTLVQIWKSPFIF